MNFADTARAIGIQREVHPRNGIGNTSRAHVDRPAVPTSFCRQRFRKDLNTSVKGNNYALPKGFQTSYVFLLRALESVLVLGKS